MKKLLLLLVITGFIFTSCSGDDDNEPPFVNSDYKIEVKNLVPINDMIGEDGKIVHQLKYTFNFTNNTNVEVKNAVIYFEYQSTKSLIDSVIIVESHIYDHIPPHTTKEVIRGGEYVFPNIVTADRIKKISVKVF